LSRISKEKAEVETLLRDANKEFPNDDNVKKLFEQYKGFFKETFLLDETKGHEASVKTKPEVVKAKEAAEKPKPVKNVKELAEKPKEPAEEAHEAPQNVKPKPAVVKTKEAAKKPKPAKNTKEAAEKPMPAENVKELTEKPKESAGDDYQVVHAATVMKAEDREEFEFETFTQWIEGNIDWVREDELHDWPRVVEPINTVQPSSPKRVFFSPSKGYVKPVKTVNTPYMCRRIDVTAR
nr:cytochrome P450 [Tanacetum cinerariifolium]